MAETTAVWEREEASAGPGSSSGGSAWIPLLAWFLLGAGGSLSLASLMGLLAPVLGGGAAASGSVLAALLGALWAGTRLPQRGSRPAPFLLASAGFLLVAPWILPVLGPLAGLAWRAGHGTPFLLFLFRFTLALAAVAVPAGALGGALAAVSASRPGLLSVPLLAAGAAFAQVLCIFLREWRGEFAVAVLAALILVGAAVLTGILFRRATAESPTPAASPAAADVRPVDFGIAATFVWGFTAVAAVMAWERILCVTLGPFPATSSLAVGLFLSGAAVGSLAAALAIPARAESTFPGSALLIGLAGIAAAATMRLLDSLPILYLALAPSAAPDPYRYTLGTWSLAARLVLPPALFWGAALGSMIRAEAFGESDSRSGATILSLRCGALLAGAAAAAWVIPGAVMPHFGFRRTLLAVAVVLLTASAVGLAGARGMRILFRVLAPMGAVAAAAALCLTPIPGTPTLLSSGVYRFPTEILGRLRSGSLYRLQRMKVHLAFYQEGAEATAAVERADGKQGPDLALTQDGVLVGTTSLDLIPQILSAEIPLLLRPSARKVLLVGYGTGIAAGSALLRPLTLLEAVEPEAAVVEASRQFEPANRSPRGDPRLRIIVDDPRQVLQAREKGAYDLILVRPTAPENAASRWQATTGFYRLAASRLKKGGLLAQALPLRGLDATDLAALLATVRSAFGDVVLFQTYYQELLVLASQDTIRFDREGIHQAMADAQIASDLGRVGIAEPEAILVRHRLSGRGMKAFLLGTGRVVTDSGPPLAWAGYRPGAPPMWDRTLEAVDRFSTGFAERLVGVKEGKEGDALLLKIARAALAIGDPIRAVDLGEALLARGQAADGHQILGDANYLRHQLITATEEWHKALEADPRNVSALVSLAGAQVDRQNFQGAEEYLRQALAIEPSSAALRYQHGRALYYMNRYAESEKDLVKALATEGEQGAPMALYYLGLIQKEKKNLPGAVEFLRRYLLWAYRQRRLTPVEADVHLTLAEIYEAIHFPELAAEQKKAGEKLKERLKAAGVEKRKILLDLAREP